MTNVYQTPNKGRMKRRLFEIGVEALEAEGWTVERAPGVRASSVRRITKGSKSLLVSIRTTQDTWIAFPRTGDDNKPWRTLSDVDAVVPVSVDNSEKPRLAKVHMIDGDEIRDRFDQAYEARVADGQKIPLNRGVWVSLYDPENKNVPRLVGAGAGLNHPTIAEVPLHNGAGRDSAKAPASVFGNGVAPLTVTEAKERLAATFGVSPDSVQITIQA